MAWNFEYPYIDSKHFNDDWLILTVKKLIEEFTDFVNLNKIKYANPILWDITRQYEVNTVVVDGRTGNAYISVRPVPAGVQIDNTTYWTQIYNYADVVDTLRAQIAINEGDRTTASQPFEKGDIVFISGLLYEVIAPMIAGDSFVVDSNIKKITIAEILEKLIAEDKTLSEAIENEATAREEADDALSDDIESEQRAREEADSALGEEIDAVRVIAEKSPVVTPQQYGAVGDGVSDDTEAFSTLALNNNPCIIPKGNYLINERVVLNNVVADEGSYPNYCPEYARKLELPMQAISFYKHGLLSIDGYEETACYIDGKYYVIVRDTSQANTNALVTYDANVDEISLQSVTNATFGIVNSCCTDGEYIYVDYDTGYHVKYNPVDFTNPVLVVEDEYYRNIGYYNHQLYAVAIGETSVTISKLASDLTTKTEPFTVETIRQTLQSSTIYKGQLYILTTEGYFTAIDLISHEIKSIPYYDDAKEYEAFFEKDGELLVLGHYPAASGVFHFGRFDFGVDAHQMQYISLNNNLDHFQAQYIDSRVNFYHIINGLNNNALPFNTCDVLWTRDGIIAFSASNNGIYVYIDNEWSLVGTFKPVTVNADSTAFQIMIGTDGNVYARFINYRVQQSAPSYRNQISADMSTIYNRLRWGDSKTVSNCFITRGYGRLDNTDTYAVMVTVTKTGIDFQIKNLNPSATTIDALLDSQYFITVH